MIIGVSITKQVSFRGVQQEFSNVYHYTFPGAVTGPWEDIVDEIKAFEVPWHSTDVSFVRAAVWSAGGSPGSNQMLFQKDLSGTGSSTNNASMDRERAVLIRWPAGFASNGKPVFLRKWYHSCGAFAGNTFSAGVLQQTSPLTGTQIASIAAAADAATSVGITEDWELCSPTGRVWEDNAQCHTWLEHHQLGDMWR